MYINLPNILTITRIFLVPIFIYTLLNNFNSYLPILIFCFSTVTDALDGLIARSLKLKTTTGIYLDPIADKALILSSYFVLAMLNRTPIWLLVIILGKDVILISGWLLIYILSGKYKISVSFLGKLNMAMQMLTILVVLLNFPKILLLFYITGLMTIITTIEYCITGAKEITSIYIK